MSLQRSLAVMIGARHIESEQSLLARIRSVTCGEMLQASKETSYEWELVPSAYRGSNGMQADIVAGELGFSSTGQFYAACWMDSELRKETRKYVMKDSLEEAKEAPEYQELCMRHEAEWTRLCAEREQILPHLQDVESRIWALEQPPIPTPEAVAIAPMPVVSYPITHIEPARPRHPGRTFRRWLGLALAIFWYLAPRQNNGYWWYAPVATVTFLVVYLEARYWIRRWEYGIR